MPCEGTKWSQKDPFKIDIMPQHVDIDIDVNVNVNVNVDNVDDVDDGSGKAAFDNPLK